MKKKIIHIPFYENKNAEACTNHFHKNSHGFVARQSAYPFTGNNQGKKLTKANENPNITGNKTWQILNFIEC